MSCSFLWNMRPRAANEKFVRSAVALFTRASVSRRTSSLCALRYSGRIMDLRIDFEAQALAHRIRERMILIGEGNPR